MHISIRFAGVKWLFLSVLISFCSFASAKSPLRLLSPGNKILFEFEIRNGVPGYRVSYEGKSLVDFSGLDIYFNGDSLSRGVHLEKSSRMDSTERYSLITGRSAGVNDFYRQLNIYLVELNSPKRKILLQIRAFDDGVAFRYLFPGSGGELLIMQERTIFQISGNPRVHALVLPDYYSSHEGNYIRRVYQELPSDSLMDMPMLFEYPGNIYMALTEASLLDYAGMYLMKTGSALVSTLSRLPQNSTYAVKAQLPHESPWRVMLISNRPGRFLETNLITDLAPPCRLTDLEWLRPGKTTFPWWNGNVTPDTLNAPGNNFVTQQYYIDFCARSGIEYHSVVEYGLHQWYQDDGVSFMPGPNSNVLNRFRA